MRTLKRPSKNVRFRKLYLARLREAWLDGTLDLTISPDHPGLDRLARDVSDPIVSEPTDVSGETQANRTRAALTDRS